MGQFRTSAPLLADMIGGVSVTGLLIPEAVAYASIAGLPPSFGIIAAIVGPLSYSLVGRSCLAVVSATSGAAALLAAALGNVALPHLPRAEAATALVGLVGISLLVGAALRIGALTSFISRAVLKGFGFGLAVIICIRQLPALLGMASPSGTPWSIVAFVAAHLQNAHLPSVVLGGTALLLLTISRRLRIPGAGLFILIGAAVLMRLGPSTHFGIALVGPVALQIGMPHLPAMSARELATLGQVAVPVAIIILAESWATIRSLAAIRGDPVSPQREIAALGLANLASGMAGGLPVGAGFSIGNANEQAGTASRVGAIIAALTVAIAALTAASWVAVIPQPLLAAIVISALAHALSPKPIMDLFRVRRDQWVAICAAAAVLLLGIINGLLIATGLSVLGLLRRLARPRLSELGRIGVHDFVDRSTHSEAVAVPGVFIVRPDGPVFFGNADSVLDAIGRQAHEQQASAIVLSLEETDDLDSSSVDALAQFKNEICANGTLLYLARVHDRARDVLARAGLSDLAATATFSVDDAVQLAIKALAARSQSGTVQHSTAVKGAAIAEPS